MSEVKVNINGDSGGLNNALDSLREKAKQLGVDMSKLSEDGLGKKTFTEQKVSLSNSVREIAEAKKASTRSDFDSIRKSNVEDLNQAHTDFKSGKISRKTLEEHKNNFETSQKDSRTNESKEILTIEKEMNQHLRTIVREMVQNRQISKEKLRQETNKDQIDNDEHKPHSPGTETGSIRTKSDPKGESSDSKDRDNNTLNRFSAAGSAAASGNLQGTVTNGVSGAGSLLGMSKGGAATAGIIAAIWGLLTSGDKIQNAAGEVGAFRGNGMTGAGNMRNYANNFDNGGMLKNLNISGEDFLGMMKSKAQASGSTENLRERTMDDAAFQKGFGADVSPLSGFERFNKNGETSLQVSMDILNVLTSIDKSSLTEGDLISLQNKINTQASLFDIQRSKRDAVDPDDSLRILAAFESIGLSQKGDKAGNFLGNVISGLGEGGGDNAMMLKYEMAKRTNPELANDPAALRRFVKYHNDDPDYMLKSLSGFGDLTKGNGMAEDDLIMSMFNPSSEADYNMIKESMGNNKQFKNLLGGKGLNKAPKQSLTKEAMYQEAQASTGDMSAVIKDFTNTVAEMGINALNWINDLTGGNKSLNVKTLIKPVVTTTTNKVSKGKGTGK